MRKLVLGAALAGMALVGLGVAAKHSRKMREAHCGGSSVGSCHGEC